MKSFKLLCQSPITVAQRFWVGCLVHFCALSTAGTFQHVGLTGGAEQVTGLSIEGFVSFVLQCIQELVTQAKDGRRPGRAVTTRDVST